MPVNFNPISIAAYYEQNVPTSAQIQPVPSITYPPIQDLVTPIAATPLSDMNIAALDSPFSTLPISGLQVLNSKGVDFIKNESLRIKYLTLHNYIYQERKMLENISLYNRQMMNQFVSENFNRTYNMYNNYELKRKKKTYQCRSRQC